MYRNTTGLDLKKLFYFEGVLGLDDVCFKEVLGLEGVYFREV